MKRLTKNHTRNIGEVSTRAVLAHESEGSADFARAVGSFHRCPEGETLRIDSPGELLDCWPTEKPADYTTRELDAEKQGFWIGAPKLTECETCGTPHIGAHGPYGVDLDALRYQLTETPKALADCPSCKKPVLSPVKKHPWIIPAGFFALTFGFAVYSLIAGR